MTAIKEECLGAQLALRYAGDLLFDALLRAGRSMKVSEAARTVGRPDFDVPLARVVLSHSPDRFLSQERRWALTTRAVDPHHPVERTLEEVLEASGRPQPEGALAAEVARAYGRVVAVYAEAVKRLLTRSERFARIGGYGYARRCWLLDVSSSDPDDVLFDNFLEASDVAPFEAASSILRPGDTESVLRFLDEVGAPVPSKVLQFLLWRLKPRGYVPEAQMAALLDAGAVLLSGQQWLGPAGVAQLVAQWPAIAKWELPLGAGERAGESQPLTISETELDQLVSYVNQHERMSRGAAMLEDVFEVSPGDETYEGDLKTLVEHLRQDPRVLWVGSDRFLPVGSIPEYVFSVPENLFFNDTVYYDSEGNPVDTLLEDEGLTGTLRQDILSPLAQDVLDEEPLPEQLPEPPVTVRCVLKFHHKEIGTFPLCQLPPGYFPTEPTICQVDVELPSGQVVQVWVNNETRLLYGLLDWYNTVPIDTGAVFYLERKGWDRYALTWGEETEPAMFVSRNRVSDLLELRVRAESEELPTFEILRTILEHYRKGIEFITALTEVCIVRRVRRRMVASLLSAYHCFYMRNNVWVFDARRLTQGFDKSRRKYLMQR